MNNTVIHSCKTPIVNETRGQNNWTKGRIAVRTNRTIVYNDKTFNLNGVKFNRLAHH